MKKFILVVLAISIIFVFTACGDNSDEPTGSNTAINNQVEIDGVTYDEAAIKEALSVYDLGLSSSIYEYNLKLSLTKYNDKDGVKAEAYLGDAKEPEGVFMVIGVSCYVFSKEHNRYLFLTMDGAIDLNPTQPAGNSSDKDESNGTTKRTEDTINQENNSELHSRYKNYDLSVVNLTKDISEYDFQVTGKSQVASNGVTVYTIYVLDNGTYADAIFGIGDDGKDYYYDPVKDDYLLLS